MTNKIEIFQSKDGLTHVDVKFLEETVWLTQAQMAELFETTKQNISQHIVAIYAEAELQTEATVKKFLTVRQEGARQVKRQLDFYNLNMIISVGYRVKSRTATRFRIWATQRLKDYLVQGYAINEKRLAQKQQEVEYLKSGIRILGRVIEEKVDESNHEMLKLFSKGLELLDDYDHENLDTKGTTSLEAVYPKLSDYMSLIDTMYSEFESDVFAKPKDGSFQSSINQIKQSFGDQELYPSLEEKAATLLYLIVKNHSFVDGNKRIAAACFLLFLEQNNILYKEGDLLITNDALATLTLFIASSKSEESDTVKRLTLTVLNRNKQ